MRRSAAGAASLIVARIGRGVAPDRRDRGGGAPDAQPTAERRANHGALASTRAPTRHATGLGWYAGCYSTVDIVPHRLADTMDRKQSSGSENKGLSSSEYRARLLTKLNCLIAVLEVAIAKISRSMDVPGANEERLMKIRSNLENTLSICSRAKQTLESGLAPRSLPGPSSPSRSANAKAAADRRMSYRDYVELSSIEEYTKFKRLPPIKSQDLERVDLDDLIDQLFTG
jgi:hypothetical protein